MTLLMLSPYDRSILDRLRGIYDPHSDQEILSMAISELLYQSTRPAPDRRPYLEVPMLLIEIRNPQGVHARCDAACYDATDEDCSCPCGGANHGIGLPAAINNIPSIVASRIPHLWIQAHVDELPPACMAYAQLPLWVDVNSYTTIAAIAMQLVSARQAAAADPDPDAP